MASVCAAGFTGQLAAHAVPSQMGSIQRGLSRLPKAIPKFIADWQTGLPRAKLIVSRLELDGPQGKPYVAEFGFAHRGDADIWVDKELPNLMSRQEFLEYITWRNDLQSVGRMTLPLLYFGPLGLVKSIGQLRAEHELPSQLVETEEDKIRQRLNQDLLRIRGAPAVRASLYWNLVCGGEGSNITMPTFTETEHDELFELFDMDKFSTSNMALFNKWIPLLGKKFGGMHQTVLSHHLLRDMCQFWNLNWRTLAHNGRQKAIVEHFRVLRNDDHFIRQAGGVEALSDEEVFLACHARAVARQEESEITVEELRKRLGVWLMLGDTAHWKAQGYGPYAPSPFWQTLFAVNVYTDPAFDPSLDKLAIEKIQETPGVSKADVTKRLGAAYERHVEHMTGAVKKEAVAAYEASELQRVEREAAALKSMDKLVTTMQSIGHDDTATDSVEEHIITETKTEKKRQLTPMERRMLLSAVKTEKIRELTREEAALVELTWQQEVASGSRRGHFDVIKEHFPQFIVSVDQVDSSMKAAKDELQAAS